MNTEELKELQNKIMEALKISGKMLVEEKRRLGQMLVISENGVIKYVDPNDIKI